MYSPGSKPSPQLSFLHLWGDKGEWTPVRRNASAFMAGSSLIVPWILAYWRLFFHPNGSNGSLLIPRLFCSSSYFVAWRIESAICTSCAKESLFGSLLSSPRPCLTYFTPSIRILSSLVVNTVKNEHRAFDLAIDLWIHRFEILFARLDPFVSVIQENSCQCMIALP